MNVLLFNIIFSICIHVISIYFNRNKLESLLYTVTFILLLTPSSLMLGLELSSTLNIQFSYFFTLVILPVIVLQRRKLFLNKKLLINYKKKIGKYLLFLLIFKFALSFYRLFVYEINPLSDFINSSKEFILILILTFFYYIGLSQLSSEKQLKFIKTVFGIFTVVVASFGMLVLLDISPFNNIQIKYYNFKSLNSGGAVSLMSDSILRDHRTYSVFSSANQFGTFSAIAIAIASTLYKAKKINILMYSVFFVSGVFIFYASQSRTSFFFFFFFMAITLMSKFNIKTLFLMGVLIIASFLFYDLLPERLTNSLNSSSFQEKLEGQRISFWWTFFENVSFDVEFIFHGSYNETFLNNNLKFYESGVLNFLSKHGLISFIICWSLFIKSLIHSYKERSDNNVKVLKNISFWTLLILISGELLQGWMLSYRFETILSIIIALVYLYDDLKQINSHKT